MFINLITLIESTTLSSSKFNFAGLPRGAGPITLVKVCSCNSSCVGVGIGCVLNGGSVGRYCGLFNNSEGEGEGEDDLNCWGLLKGEGDGGKN